MIINDIHHHVATAPTTFGAGYTFDVFLRERNMIQGATVLFILPNYNHLYPCPSDHHYKVVPKEDRIHELIFRCCNCGNISYEGKDPYRNDNEFLINLCKDNPNVYPFIYLTLCESTIESEFQYFREHYERDFYGIKVHPNLCCKKISEISFNSKFPIIIHAGMQPEDNPDDIIKFAENYEGNVLIAHMARCSIKTLKKIKEIPNIFVDTSPTYLASQICNRFTSRYYPSEQFDLNTVSDVFKRLIELVGVEKVIFGSDAPFGSLNESIKLYNELTLSKEMINAVFETNFNKFISKLK